MAARNPELIQVCPGDLYLNPTDIDSEDSSDWGTLLGMQEDVAFYFGYREAILNAKEDGMTVEVMTTSIFARITMMARSFDEDLLTLIHPNGLSTHTASEKKYVDISANVGGKRKTANTYKIWLKPREPEEHDSVLFFNAAVYTTGSRPIDYELEKKWGEVVIFEAMKGESGRFVKFGKAEYLGNDGL